MTRIRSGAKPYVCTVERCLPSIISCDLVPAKHAHPQVTSRLIMINDTPVCTQIAASNTDPTHYLTWTSFQAHPPTCMHLSCNGRTFAS
ncbi:hypothetical protein F4604DRAFT_1755546 [Suillus subluteus]|nr:hypothetical protein F4604DRAFT_1755546 [Suillus subluteus]